MKPGSVARPTLNIRRSKSLYGRYEIQGKKEQEQRKSVFKAPNSVARIPQSNLNRQSRGISKAINNGPGNARPSQVHGGYQGVNANIQAKSKFLRPKIDMLAARKRMFERTLHLKQNTGTDVEEKNSDVKDFEVMHKLNLACTPKQSALTKVYLKLTESAKKAAKSRQLFPQTQSSPFSEGEILHKKSNLKSAMPSATDNCQNFKNGTHSSKPLIPCNSKMDEDASRILVISKPNKQTSVDFPDFTLGENRKGTTVQNSGNCPLNNILKHCQLYCTKISSIMDAITCLDESFQRVVVGEVGGHVYSNFCEYQKKKLKLYREMKVVEEELEDSVRNEVDVQARFQDYLKKKVNIWKEESDLLEEFKKTVNGIIDKYEEKVVKPPVTNGLHELVQMLSSSAASEKDVSNDSHKPVLRRSQRLLTPKRVATNGKTCRVLRSNSNKKKVEECDDLIKGNTKSREKRCIQRSIYKDLQKSFNLYSPECSF